MKDEPQKHKAEYKKSWDEAINRFTGEFISEFCFRDGSINWEKLVELVSEDRDLKKLSKEQTKL